MRPSSTKRGYIISHSDLSKSMAECKPPHSVSTARACTALILIFLDFLRGAPTAACFCQRSLREEVPVSENVG
jgi:hypothetical protein